MCRQAWRHARRMPDVAPFLIDRSSIDNVLSLTAGVTGHRGGPDTGYRGRAFCDRSGLRLLFPATSVCALIDLLAGRLAVALEQPIGTTAESVRRVCRRSCLFVVRVEPPREVLEAGQYHVSSGIEEFLPGRGAAWDHHADHAGVSRRCHVGGVIAYVDLGPVCPQRLGFGGAVVPPDNHVRFDAYDLQASTRVRLVLCGDYQHDANRGRGPCSPQPPLLALLRSLQSRSARITRGTARRPCRLAHLEATTPELSPREDRGDGRPTAHRCRR